MKTLVIAEHPLNDDTLYLADKGKIFSGNYIAVLEYYTYANQWSDKKHRRGFRTLASLKKYLSKHYPSFDYEYDSNFNIEEA